MNRKYFSPEDVHALERLSAQMVAVIGNLEQGGADKKVLEKAQATYCMMQAVEVSVNRLGKLMSEEENEQQFLSRFGNDMHQLELSLDKQKLIPDEIKRKPATKRKNPVPDPAATKTVRGDAIKEGDVVVVNPETKWCFHESIECPNCGKAVHYSDGEKDGFDGYRCRTCGYSEYYGLEPIPYAEEKKGQVYEPIPSFNVEDGMKLVGHRILCAMHKEGLGYFAILERVNPAGGGFVCRTIDSSKEKRYVRRGTYNWIVRD